MKDSEKITPIQAEIIVESGFIKSIIPSKGNVRINSDGKIIDYPNAFAYRGFADAHGHVAGFGITLSIIDLTKLKSAEECAETALNSGKFRGNWIYGRGWNQELWYDKTMPDKKILDKYFPDIPCCFIRVDGHSAWLNSKALEMACIGPNTINPDGGEIVRDKSGMPSGILLDNAMELVTELIPKYSTDQITEIIKLSLNTLKQAGLTSVHDMDADPGLIPIYKNLDDSGLLPLHIHSFIKAQNDEWLKNRVEPYRGNLFSVTGLKFYADGALGSRGAALLEDYGDAPGNKGLFLINRKDLFEKASLGIEKGFHIAVHAIGDAANRLVIETFALLRKQYPDAVLRLEHAQMIHPDDLIKIRDNNILCSVQPIHCLSDAPMAEKRTGSRNSYSYRWKSLLENNIPIAGGSDFPIESHNPLTGIDAFVNRIPYDRSESWYPQEKISIWEALKAYTISPKMFLNEDSNYGLVIGKKPEITILDQDLTAISPDELIKVKALDTFML